MFDILSVLPGRKKSASNNWTKFNAICCHHRGHKADKKMRGGIKYDGVTNWVYHCFNCQFACSFVLGKSISAKTRSLLEWGGVDKTDIQRWSLESLQNKDLLDFSQTSRKRVKIKFNDHILPAGELLDSSNNRHSKYKEYLLMRGIHVDDYPFLVTPHEKNRNKNRIVIPYTYENKIVGHTSRFLDNKTPKYINDQQPGYVFGYDFQKPEWSVCILVEGIFDALSIDACALMHNTITESQASMLSQLNRQIIFVPDRDRAGLEVCDRALELGYSISIPNWSSDVKDVNDAIVKYGRLSTILSILQSATHSKIKIEMKRNKIVKSLRD